MITSSNGNIFPVTGHLCGELTGPRCVRLGNSLSDIKPISIGVPQGSVLGPILFLLYVNDLPQHIKNEQCNMFADDTIIYSSGQSISEIQSKLQMAIDSVIPWYESNRLAVNTEKSSDAHWKENSNSG